MNGLPIMCNTCPICDRPDLKPLFEHNLIMGIHETVCENENYKHVEFNGTHYFVRKNVNIEAERQMPSTSIVSREAFSQLIYQ